MPQVRVKKPLLLIVFVLAALVAFLAPEAAADGRSLVVDLDEPFEINGKLYQPSKVTIREVGDYSPVASFNEIRVNHHSLGVVLATETRESVRAPVADHDTMIFHRGLHGHLVLHAVALEGESHRILRFGTPAVLQASAAAAPLVAKASP